MAQSHGDGAESCCFEGSVFGLTGELPRKQLESTLKLNGGSVSAIIHKRVSFVVCTADAAKYNTQKVRKAVKHGIPLVSQEFITSCTLARRVVDHTPFRIAPTTTPLSPLPTTSAAESATPRPRAVATTLPTKRAVQGEPASSQAEAKINKPATTSAAKKFQRASGSAPGPAKVGGLTADSGWTEKRAGCDPSGAEKKRKKKKKKRPKQEGIESKEASVCRGGGDGISCDDGSGGRGAGGARESDGCLRAAAEIDGSGGNKTSKKKKKKKKKKQEEGK